MREAMHESNERCNERKQHGKAMRGCNESSNVRKQLKARKLFKCEEAEREKLFKCEEAEREKLSLSVAFSLSSLLSLNERRQREEQ